MNTSHTQENRQSKFYKHLIALRAQRESTFINARGYKHTKNRNDKTGVSYAFWVERGLS